MRSVPFGRLEGQAAGQPGGYLSCVTSGVTVRVILAMVTSLDLVWCWMGIVALDTQGLGTGVGLERSQILRFGGAPARSFFLLFAANLAAVFAADYTATLRQLCRIVASQVAPISGTGYRRNFAYHRRAKRIGE